MKVILNIPDEVWEQFSNTAQKNGWDKDTMYEIVLVGAGLSMHCAIQSNDIYTVACVMEDVSKQIKNHYKKGTNESLNTGNESRSTFGTN
jgi:hypothetical protein